MNIQTGSVLNINNSNNSLSNIGVYNLRLQHCVKNDVVCFTGRMKTPSQIVNEGMLKHYLYIFAENAISEYLAKKGCNINSIKMAIGKLKQQLIDINTNVLDEAGIKFSKEEADAALLYFQVITPVKKQMNEIAMRKLLLVYDRFLTKSHEEITPEDNEFVSKAFELLRDVTGVDEKGNNGLDEKKFDELSQMGINFSDEEKKVILEYKQTYDKLLKQNPLVKQYEIKAGKAQQVKTKKLTDSGKYPNDYFDKVMLEALNSR